MIVVDTNVISEMMRDNPNSAVLAWTAAAGRLYTTAITVAEVDYRIARLPEGRRRDQITQTATDVFDDFHDVILAFDVRAARRLGDIVARRESIGRPIGTADAQIAAVCASRQAILATRNVGDFEETGIKLVNPWHESPR